MAVASSAGRSRVSDEKTTASIRTGPVHYQGKCEARVKCGKRARIQLEGVNKVGHPIWHRDYCLTHARSVLKRAEARGVWVS
jgi:hypothetical protein